MGERLTLKDGCADTRIVKNPVPVGSCKALAFRGGDGTRLAVFADARGFMESEASERQRTRRHDWRVWPTTAALAIFVQILFAASEASGQARQTVQPPGDLKKLSLDELQAMR